MPPPIRFKQQEACKKMQASFYLVPGRPII